jgi:hypothetical protein
MGTNMGTLFEIMPIFCPITITTAPLSPGDCVIIRWNALGTNQVWSMDFVFDRKAEGPVIKSLTVESFDLISWLGCGGAGEDRSSRS